MLTGNSSKSKQLIFAIWIKFLREDRPGSKKGGGVCFCIKNNHPFSDVNIPASINDLEVIAIAICGTLMNAYKPPSNLIDIKDVSFVKDFCKCYHLRRFYSLPTIKCGMIAHQIRMVNIS